MAKKVLKLKTLCLSSLGHYALNVLVWFFLNQEELGHNSKTQTPNVC